jgi:prepilin-type N-terminal cleavage/methylation domain-containing protein
MPVTRRRGFTLIELLIVMGIVTVAVFFGHEIGMRRQETATIQAIRALQSAQARFYSQNHRFAASLCELETQGIPAELASGIRFCYRFRLDQTPSGYAIHAEPLKYAVGGKRTFYSDETMVLRQHEGPEPANADSEEAK